MKKLLAVAVLLFAGFAVPSAKAASVELEALPLSAPSADMMAAAGQVTIPTGPTYFYVATTVDTGGFESPFSNQVSATFNQGQHIATLTWVTPTLPTGGASIAGYNIYRSKTTGGPYAKINTAMVVGVTTYSDPFVLPNAPSLSVTTQ